MLQDITESAGKATNNRLKLKTVDEAAAEDKAEEATSDAWRYELN